MKKFNSLKFNNLLLPFLGFAALMWFLFRVIPKPSRATYPCMRTAAPLASSFVIYMIGLYSTAYIFTRAKSYFQRSKYALFGVAIFASIIVAFITMSTYNIANAAPSATYAQNLVDTTPDGHNNPMGTGVGVMPGRVAWVHNPNATDENKGSTWYKDESTNQSVVSDMFVEGLQLTTNTTSEQVAWDSIFHYYNRTHGRGNVGYTAGEKLVIKLNHNAPSSYTANINTSSQLIFAIINSLVNTVKVAQGDIIYGDPNKATDYVYYNGIHPSFPKVRCFDDPFITSKTEKITSSEASTTHSTYMPQAFVDATYLINVPILKKHHRAGISLSSKLHFGTVAASEGGAWNWHFSLPAPDANGEVTNGEYGSYRCFVDFMGYKHMGGKTILYVMDGLWSSINWGHPAIKWRMAPFNNDYPNSLFLSQDPVAIESVGFDFLFYEFDKNHPTEGAFDPGDDHGPFPHYKGTDDFLHQAADKANWPAGVTYAPNGDGVVLPSSMGTHEHWNNAIDKQYSRNLGLNKGIELVYNKLTKDVSINGSEVNSGLTSYPNPFTASVTFIYNLASASNVCLSVFDLKGALVREIVNYAQESGTHEIKWDGLNDNGLIPPTGIYVAKIEVRSNNKYKYQVIKIIKK